jgi:glycosyltransferase involved in cell wall biosynthesis
LNIGGPAIHAMTLSRDLAPKVFATRLIYGRLSRGEGNMTSLLPIDGLDAVYLPALVRQITPWNDLRALWGMYREFRRLHPNIVHTHTAKAGTVGRLAALAYNFTRRRGQKARVLHTYHGHVFDGYFRTLRTKVFLSIERWLAARTDVLITISPLLKQELVGKYRIAEGEKVRVIALGLPLDRFLAIDGRSRARARADFAIPPNSIVVTTVGRLTAIKQHRLFLSMASELARRSDRYLFLIVGDGELRSDLEAHVATVGLQRSVRFLGWRGDLENVYAATDIFVLTSRNEGTPVALIEAMAAGVASVSTDVGGVRDVLVATELGRVVPPADAGALVDAVESFAADPQLRAETGVRARLSSRRFHASRLINDIEGLYCELLANGCTIPPASS